MGRRPTPARTLLGNSIRERRAGQSQREVEEAAAVPHTTLSRLERGTHRPTYDTAVKLAAWLGWTTDQVMAAADQPAPTLSQET